MKLAKLDGIKIMEKLNIPTVKRMSLVEIIEGQIPIDCGISVRTSSSGGDKKWNVYMPSIHGCTDIEKVKKFISKNKKYEIFAHETVKPEVIGSISRLEHTSQIVLEIYKNFEERKNEIISNRMTIPINNDRIWISHLSMLNENAEDFKNFKKVLLYLKDIPFEQYDMEYVIQNGDVMFTDLTLPDGREMNNYKALIQKSDSAR